ncbi:MAG: hypothetical protein IKO03_00685 [Lachnospiraceae bacterium]|nr:hypothetical protein [Oscillospiraceae bacterium]MBR3507292.1 hypothetical protein [Lachnospiraceae bacterium]MBR6152218.1 hypothetical protein [Lachnospiraceae bacterium]
MVIAESAQKSHGVPGYKYLIHAAVPEYKSGHSSDKLKSCYVKALTDADTNSYAFSYISDCITSGRADTLKEALNDFEAYQKNLLLAASLNRPLS